MATVVVNKPDHLEFTNIKSAASPDDSPTIVFQVGDWDAAGHTESGIIVDVFGEQLPLLAPADARKLAKWLNRAADELDGGKTDKKQKYHPRRDVEEDDAF